MFWTPNLSLPLAFVNVQPHSPHCSLSTTPPTFTTFHHHHHLTWQTQNQVMLAQFLGFWCLTPLSHLCLWMHGLTTLIASHKQSHQHPNTSHHCCLAQKAWSQATMAQFQVFSPQTSSLALCLWTHISSGNTSCCRSVGTATVQQQCHPS